MCRRATELHQVGEASQHEPGQGSGTLGGRGRRHIKGHPSIKLHPKTNGLAEAEKDRAAANSRRVLWQAEIHGHGVQTYTYARHFARYPEVCLR